MNRLTRRRTTRNDFEVIESCYWMNEDENTAEKFVEKYPFTFMKWPRFGQCNEHLNKLGAIEDLMERYNINSLEELEERLK